MINRLCLRRYNQVQRLLPVLLILLIMWVVVSPHLVSAFAGLGGYISEKMLGNGTNEALQLGDGTNPLVVLGTAPTVTTLEVSNQSSGSAILNGRLDSFNSGMTRAEVWFEWGYSASSLTNSTPVLTVTTTGTKAATITGITGSTVYYRIAASTDGTTRGSITYFASGKGVSNWLMNTLLPIVIAAVVLIGVFLLTGNPLVALVSAIVGLAAFYIILALVSSI